MLAEPDKITLCLEKEIVPCYKNPEHACYENFQSSRKALRKAAAKAAETAANRMTFRTRVYTCTGLMHRVKMIWATCLTTGRQKTMNYHWSTRQCWWHSSGSATWTFITYHPRNGSPYKILLGDEMRLIRYWCEHPTQCSLPPAAHHWTIPTRTWMGKEKHPGTPRKEQGEAWCHWNTEANLQPGRLMSEAYVQKVTNN